MDPHAESDAAVCPPRPFELGGRTFLLPPASIESYQEWNLHCRELVRADMAPPLESLNAQLYELDAAAAAKKGQPIHPALLGALASQAVTLGSGDKGKGKAEPTQEQIMAKSLTREAVAYWTWYRLFREYPDVTREWVNQNVTGENWKGVLARLGEVDALGKAVLGRTTPGPG